MSSDNPYGQPPSGAWGQGGPPPGPGGPFGYPPSQPGPAQPPGAPGSGYAFGPFAPPPGTGPGMGGPPAAGPPPAGNRARVLIIVGVVVLALILVGIGAAVIVRSRAAAGPDPIPPSPGQPGSVPPSSGPPAGPLASDAVTAYLTALSAGDAKGALAYAARPLPAGRFLTDAVLAESIKRAPITGIAVPAVDDPLATTVAAGYKIGATPVRVEYGVEQVGGQWKLSSVFKTLDLSLVRSPSIPIRINGVKVNSYTVDVLPGSYAFTAESPNLSFGSKAVVTVRDPNDYANVLDLKLGLSKAGERTVVKLAKQRYGQCLQTRVTRPQNCPFRWTNPAYRFREGRVRWQQTGNNPWRKPRVQMVERAARLVIPLRVRVSGPCTFSGNSGTCSGKVTGDALASVRMDKPKLQAVWIV